ncbi:DODA-type extradiol aromatic ring-opening family dioxygenase [Candidatus Magnetaquicoccus inordinatus]|uniref:DODA-type extradiol aromatic ring-opening family dioxygenase n=1 Tax=Candidatus Magnetaquicoccus inordinatus TaxID=2496818 RepID=UPI00102AE848|nr:class III extradiol ring-cleavage dioxygenase [Candidatus Magnetaquicoccus inordinatus]
MHTPNSSQPNNSSSRQPVWFLPHGAGPCFFMEWQPADAWLAMRTFMQQIPHTLPQPPQAILCISAHWIENSFTLGSGAQPSLLYDYYGFPPHTYQLSYPAAGAPWLAQRAAELLQQAAIPAQQNPSRGFDHGMFIPLKVIFPAAQIPVVQLSLQASMDPRLHLQAGRALAPLREQGVAIIGSGMSFHNMRGYGKPPFAPISDRFDQWLCTTVEAHAELRAARLCDWQQAPEAHLCHPPGAEEHLIPLMLIAGAAGDDPGKQVFSDRVMETTLSAFRFA